MSTFRGIFFYPFPSANHRGIVAMSNRVKGKSMVSRRNLEGIVKMGFSLTPEQVTWLNERAAAEDRSMSAVIRRLIDEEAERTTLSPERRAAELAKIEADMNAIVGAPPVEVEGKP